MTRQCQIVVGFRTSLKGELPNITFGEWDEKKLCLCIPFGEKMFNKTHLDQRHGTTVFGAGD